MVSKILSRRRAGFRALGHLGIRVGDKIFHINPKGVHAEDFTAYMNERFAKGHNAFGYALEISEEEKKSIVDYFEKNKDMSFKRFGQNCSATVCASLKEAGVVEMSSIKAIDPVISSRIIKNIGRPGHRTIYTNGSSMPAEVNKDNITFRAKILLPLAGAGIATGLSAAAAGVMISNMLESSGNEEPAEGSGG